MSQTHYDQPTGGEDAPASDWREGSRRFIAPLGEATHGRLVFERGAANVTLRVDAELSDLCRATFEGPVPAARAEGGVVSIRYRYVSFFDWLRYAALWDAHTAADITLNGSIPWDIEIRSGASRLTADLRDLRLRSLELEGGASRVSLALARPDGVVSIHIGGGASHVSIDRPADVGVRLRVHGGASQVTLDEQHFGAIGGGLRLETSDYSAATAHYDVEIGGGVSHLSVGTR